MNYDLYFWCTITFSSGLFIANYEIKFADFEFIKNAI